MSIDKNSSLTKPSCLGHASRATLARIDPNPNPNPNYKTRNFGTKAFYVWQTVRVGPARFSGSLRLGVDWSFEILGEKRIRGTM